MAAVAMPQAPDVSAIRRKLQSGLGQSVGAIGSMPYNPQWDQSAQNAYASLGTKLSGNDLAGQRLNQDYETNRAQQALGQENTVKNLRNRFANQGNLFSGAYVDTQADTNRQYQDIFGRLSQSRTRGLEDIDRSNTAAMADYERSIGDIGTGYSQSIQKYLADQAAATADASQKQQALAAQRALSAITQDPNWMKKIYSQQAGGVGSGI